MFQKVALIIWNLDLDEEGQSCEINVFVLIQNDNNDVAKRINITMKKKRFHLNQDLIISSSRDVIIVNNNNNNNNIASVFIKRFFFFFLFTLHWTISRVPMNHDASVGKKVEKMFFVVFSLFFFTSSNLVLKGYLLQNSLIRS